MAVRRTGFYFRCESVYLHRLMGDFRFRQFTVHNDRSALKVGTDGVLLGALADIPGVCARVLDIGTGTGVIAIMLAQRLSEALHGRLPGGVRITGIDVDGPSAAEAAANFAESPWSGNLEAVECPLSGFGDDGEFDLIVSNPPFYDGSLKNPDPRQSVARHADSLSWRDILAFASKRLSADGRLCLILPSADERALLRAAAVSGFRALRLLRVFSTERKPARRIVVSLARAASAGCPLRDGAGVQGTAESVAETLLLCDPTAPDGRTDAYRALLEPYLTHI